MKNQVEPPSCDPVPVSSVHFQTQFQGPKDLDILYPVSVAPLDGTKEHAITMSLKDPHHQRTRRPSLMTFRVV